MQWVPKNAWKTINITNRYGRDAVHMVQVGRTSAERRRAPHLADQVEPQNPAWAGTSSAAADGQKQLRELHRAGVPFIDLRDASESARRPVRAATSLHHHDILSGACNWILPKNKNARLVVFATGRQRSINGMNALRRQGYENVVVADERAVTQALQ